jgi:hypothetical protein
MKLYKLFSKKNYSTIGIYSCIIIFIPYFIDINQKKENSLILFLNIIGLFFSSLLIPNSIWPKYLRKYLIFFWYLNIIYSLFFLQTLSTFYSNDLIFSITINFITYCILHLIISYTEFLSCILIGKFFGIFFIRKFLIKENLYNYEYFEKLEIIQLISNIILSLLISRKKDKYISNLESRANLLQFIQTNSNFSMHKSMSLSKKEENQFNHAIAIPSAKEKLENIIDLYQKDELKKNLYEDLIELNEILESEEKTKIYYVLNAKKHDLSDLIYKFKKSIKSAGCNDISINSYTKEKKICCDETVLLKMLYKISNDFCSDIYKKNSGDDTDLILSIFDTKIFYQSEEEEESKNLFTRTINGICIVLGELEFDKNDDLIKNIYVKKLTDLETILPPNIYDINLIDIERGIDSHYGILENHSNQDYMNWICVIPVDVYEIRPEPLDLSEPIDAKYNWPAAVQLEKKFLEKLKKNYNFLNFEKIEYAISIIKKYHFHQTRKSGEPYYMHPISVADIVVDIIQENNNFVENFILNNIEELIISSLLHDILEDTSYSKKALTKNFGIKVRDIVLALTKIDQSSRIAMLSNSQSFQNLIEKEPLSLFIKLADRLHNMITLDGHPSIEKRKKVAQETLDFFIKPAEKYGLKNLERELKKRSNHVLLNGKMQGYMD